MTVSKEQIIHIVSELVIISVMSVYFQLKVNTLNKKIDCLETQIEQQNHVIQNHEQLLLRMMNNIDTANANIAELKKAVEVKNTKEKTIQFKSKKSENINHRPVVTTANFPNENIFVMEIQPPNKTNSLKIEEILDEKNNEDLDKELEKELKELEKEINNEDEDEDEEEDDEDDKKGDEDEDYEDENDVEEVD